MHAMHHDVSIARLGGKLLSSGTWLLAATGYDTIMLWPPRRRILSLPPYTTTTTACNLPPYSYPFFVLMVILVTTPACLATILAR